MRGVSIGIPFVQTSLSTGKGYIADMKARFWQAERHSRGIQDVAYNIKMAFEAKWSWRGFVIIYSIMENWCLMLFLPLCSIGMNINKATIPEIID